MKSLGRNTLRVLSLLALTPLAACVAYGPGAGGYPPGAYGYDQTPPPSPPPTEVQYVDADVVSVTPVYRDVQVAQPRQACQQVPVDNTGNHVAGTLLGAAIGGLVGNQFGRGSGNAAMTAAGAVAGAAAGNSVAAQGDAQTATRCRTVNDYEMQRQQDGYDVAYRYNGRVYHTHRAVDPGAKIRVRVAVTPSSD